MSTALRADAILRRRGPCAHATVAGGVPVTRQAFQRLLTHAALHTTSTAHRVDGMCSIVTSNGLHYVPRRRQYSRGVLGAVKLRLRHRPVLGGSAQVTNASFRVLHECTCSNITSTDWKIQTCQDAEFKNFASVLNPSKYLVALSPASRRHGEGVYGDQYDGCALTKNGASLVSH
jgi:hypothetical protein